MAEYIEREALKRDLIDNRSFYPAIVKAAIESAPAADVVEVRHGEKLLPNTEAELRHLMNDMIRKGESE